jgi:hypothetical protein
MRWQDYGYVAGRLNLGNLGGWATEAIGGQRWGKQPSINKRRLFFQGAGTLAGVFCGRNLELSDESKHIPRRTTVLASG